MNFAGLPVVAWIIFLASAILEVGGDAIIRKGMKASRWHDMVLGGLMLASYGIVVNLVKWDFSKLLGVYVAVFAVVSVLAGWFLFQEDVPATTWVGIGIIVIGGMVIQFGPQLRAMLLP